MKKKEFATKVINAYDYEIKPCSHCNYECFAKELRGIEEKCPIHDHGQWICERVKESNVTVLAVPTYGGNVSGLYKAWAEHGQAVFKDYQDLVQTILKKVIALIVVVNIPAGGDLVYYTVISDHYEAKIARTAILLQSTEYGQSSLTGTLTQDKRVRDRLDNLNFILRRWKRSREG